MKAIINFLKSLFSKKDKGFSLIELLVVVTIIGVLAAVAIPAYNKYRVNAVQASITSSLNNIGKGFAACLTLNNWDSCNELSEIDVVCAGCGTPGEDTGKTSLCVNVARRVGGAQYQGCMQSGGGVPQVVGNWPIPCRNLQIIYTCVTAGGAVTVPTKTCATAGCSNTSTAPATCPAGETTANHGCSNTTDPDALSNGTAFTGACAAGVCS